MAASAETLWLMTFSYMFLLTASGILLMDLFSPS
jgi:hypothetical protein